MPPNVAFSTEMGSIIDAHVTRGYRPSEQRIHFSLLKVFRYTILVTLVQNNK